jgi:hypothetical protein
MRFSKNFIAYAKLTICVGFAFFVFKTNAAVTITIQESGSDVIATSVGSYTVPSSAAIPGDFSQKTFIEPVNGVIYLTPAIAPTTTPLKRYVVTDLSCSFTRLGTAATRNATSTTLSHSFGVSPVPKLIIAPSSAIGGSSVDVSGTVTFANRTIASFGLTPGTYTCTWNSSSDSLTIYILSKPIASAVSQTVAYNSSNNNIALSATNTPTSVAVSTAASHGTATASGTAIIYTPAAGYFGTDTFQYTATNAFGTSSPAIATITVSPPVASTDANLSGLTLSSGALTPAFASGTIAYTQSVANAVSSITVTPTVSQANATVTVNGTAVASGSASGSINLNVGANTITTVVTAQDGTTTQTYTTTVTRGAAASTQADLSGLTFSSGALTPAFSSGTTTYTQTVSEAVSSITVTPTVSQANATVTVNGTAVASGSASGSINLNAGANTITTVVTAQDGTTTQTYTTTVTRGASLVAQAPFAVTASPSELNPSAPTSTLSTAGGSGTGAVTYAMTAGTCALSGSTVTAGKVNETCTVRATKAADSTYLAATATVNIKVTRRLPLAKAATDPSVSQTQATQLLQTKIFVQTQAQNVTSHLDTFKLNFNLQPSYSGVSVITPSLGPMAPVFYKVKDVWLANRGEVGDASYGQVGMQKAFYNNAGDRFYADGRRTEEMDESDERVPSTYTDGRKQNTHSFWSVGTVDTGLFKTGDNQEVTHKFRVSGLTLGLDYKVGSRAIVGAALGLGQDSNPSQERGSKVKSNQHSITAYGVFGLGRNWLVDGLLGHSRHSFTGNRTTSDGAAQLGMNRRTGDGAFASGSISTIFSLGPLSVAPFVRQDITHIRLNQYNETGDADYALGFGRTKQTATATSAGVHFFNDIHLPRGKLTTSLKLSANRMKTGALSQDVYYADVGAASGIYTLQQKSSQQNASSLSLGVTYSNKAGDAIDIGWMGAVGANQYKHNRVRLGLSFGL